MCVEVEACMRGGGFTLRVQQQSGGALTATPVVSNSLPVLQQQSVGASSDAPAISDSLTVSQQSDCPPASVAPAHGGFLPVLHRTLAHAVDSGMPMETIRQVH